MNNTDILELKKRLDHLLFDRIFLKNWKALLYILNKDLFFLLCIIFLIYALLI